MVQTNFEEMQKLGEKLQALVTEARPLLKDLQIALKAMHDMEANVDRKLSITREKATEAAKSYSAVIELEDIIDHKLQRIVEQTGLCTDEIDKLTELHIQVQREMSQTLEEYIAKRPPQNTGNNTGAKTYADVEHIPPSDIRRRYGV